MYIHIVPHPSSRYILLPSRSSRPLSVSPLPPILPVYCPTVCFIPTHWPISQILYLYMTIAVTCAYLPRIDFLFAFCAFSSRPLDRWQRSIFDFFVLRHLRPLCLVLGLLPEVPVTLSWFALLLTRFCWIIVHPTYSTRFESQRCLWIVEVCRLAAVAVARGVYTREAVRIVHSLVNAGKAMSVPKFISPPLSFFVAVCRRGDRVEGNCHCRYSTFLWAHIYGVCRRLFCPFIMRFVRYYRRHCFMGFLFLWLWRLQKGILQ